jgi:hypothetical protein
MGTLAGILSILLTLPPGSLIQIDPFDINKYELAPSLDNSYMVYTFNQFKDLKLRVALLEKAETDSRIYENLVKTLQGEVSAHKQEIVELKTQKDILSEQTDRRLKRIMEMTQEQEHNSWVVPTSLSIGVAGLLFGLTVFLVERNP